MTHEDFSKLLERRIELIKKTLDSKSKEYSTGENKLHNFVEASRIVGEHPAKSLDGFLLKHYVSYRDMLNKIQKGEEFSRSYLDEKFGDIINYFILQEAIFVEYGVREDVSDRLLNGTYDNIYHSSLKSWKQRDKSEPLFEARYGNFVSACQRHNVMVNSFTWFKEILNTINYQDSLNEASINSWSDYNFGDLP